MKKIIYVFYFALFAIVTSCISVEVKYSEKIKNEKIPAVLYVPEFIDYGFIAENDNMASWLVHETLVKKHITNVFSSIDKSKMREELVSMTVEEFKNSTKVNLKAENKGVLNGVKIVNHPKSNLLKHASFDFSDRDKKFDTKYIFVMHPIDWGYIASTKMTRPAGRYFYLTLVGSLYDSTSNEVLWRKTFYDEESYGLFGTHFGVSAENSFENYKKLVKRALVKFSREIEKK